MILTDFCTTLINADGMHYEWMKGLLLLHAVKHENFSELIPPGAPNDGKFWNVVYGGLHPTEFNKRVPPDFRYNRAIVLYLFMNIILLGPSLIDLQAELTSSFISTLKVTNCFCMHGYEHLLCQTIHGWHSMPLSLLQWAAGAYQTDWTYYNWYVL